jgi:hypothetical protein
MIDHAVDIYRTLFGKEGRENIRMSRDFWEESEKVIGKENDVLEAEFSEEIKRVIDGSYAKGAPSPNGLSFLFYQKF